MVGRQAASCEKQEARSLDFTSSSNTPTPGHVAKETCEQKLPCNHWYHFSCCHCCSHLLCSRFPPSSLLCCSGFRSRSYISLWLSRGELSSVPPLARPPRCSHRTATNREKDALFITLTRCAPAIRAPRKPLADSTQWQRPFGARAP